MKKFISLFCFAVLTAQLSAATIKTVAYHAVPSGKYAQLYVSGSTTPEKGPGGVIASGNLTIYSLNVPGSLTITANSPDGLLNIAPSNTYDGVFRANKLGVANVQDMIYLKSKNPGPSTAFSFLSGKSLNVSGPNASSPVSSTVAWQAWDTSVAPYGYSKKYAYGYLPPVPAGHTLRWIALKSAEPDGGQKTWYVLTSSNDSGAISKACGNSFSGIAQTCCVNGHSCSNSTAFYNTWNGFYNVALGVAGVGAMAPAYGAVTTAITSVEGGLQFMNGAYQ